MAKAKPQDISDQLQKDENKYYGEQTISGADPSPEADDDLSENYRQAFGNKPTKSENIASEIQKDEKGVLEKPIDDYKADPQPEHRERLDEKVDSDSVVPDPFDSLTDKDFKK